MKHILTFLFLLIAATASAQIDKILGDWTTIDDQINEPVSVVRIYRATNGKYYGRIDRITYPGYENALCKECKGDLHNKPMKGMIIIYDMVYNEKKQRLEGGRVLDPNNGKYYHGAIWYDSKKGCLILRGSLDSRGILGRSQEWQRAK